MKVARIGNKKAGERSLFNIVVLSVFLQLKHLMHSLLVEHSETCLYIFAGHQTLYMCVNLY